MLSAKAEEKLTINFAPNAEKNLEDIENYINENGDAKAAVSVVDDILDVCGSLQAMPRIGKARDEIAPGVRSITSGNYVIYYRINEQNIDILRVWHGHRDTAALKNEL
jgi:toxin ParE1/3/4